MASGIRDSLAINKANRMSKRAVKESTKGKDAEVVNPRVWNMFREAVEFKGAAMVPFEQELRGLESATIEYCEGILPLLRAPLPRVWDRVGSGGPLAEPLRASVTHYGHPDISGGNMDDAAMRASVAEYERNLQLKVRRPLTQWVNALEGVRGRVPELDRLRSHLERRTNKVKAQEKKAEKEERRRAGVRRAGRGFAVGRTFGVKALLYKCTHPTADLSDVEARQTGTEERAAEAGLEGVPPAEDFKKEDQDVKYKESLRKLQASVEAFSSDEGLLYEQLSGLCRDAAWMKSYVASSLLMTKELFQEIALELGDSLQPLPACKVPAPEEAARGLRFLAPAGPAEAPSEGGVEALAAAPKERTLGSNLPYVAAMPDYAQRGRARATLEEWKELAHKRLHAHMATSSPLELHALPQAKAGDIPGKVGGSRAMSVVDQQEQTAAPYGPMGGSTTSEMGTPAAATKVQTPATPAREEPPAGLGYT